MEPYPMTVQGDRFNHLQTTETHMELDIKCHIWELIFFFWKILYYIAQVWPPIQGHLAFSNCFILYLTIKMLFYHKKNDKTLQLNAMFRQEMQMFKCSKPLMGNYEGKHGCWRKPQLLRIELGCIPWCI